MSSIAYLAATMDRLLRPHALDPLAIVPLAVQARHPGAMRALSEAQGEIDRRRQAVAPNAPPPSPSDLYRVEAGVAVLEISGMLVQELPGWRPFWGMTGYNQIETMVAVALADPSVRGILLRIRSGGGEVAGCFDFTRRLAAARRAAAKPIWASAGEYACSAAYAIASAAGRISMPETGAVGSIGVVMLHVEFSQALENLGIGVSLIHAGARKVDGNPFQPLPAEVREAYLADCEAVRLLFAGIVAANRGMEVKALLATEAEVYGGLATTVLPTAKKIGLVDAIEPEVATRRALQALVA